MTDQRSSIDASIDVIEDYIKRSRDDSRRIFSYLKAFSFFALMVILMLYIFPSYFSAVASESELANVKIPDIVLYGLFAIFIVVFGVSMAVYRFHLNEIARSEHFRVGFMRIKVAANNADNEGFGSEVRQSLTADAFAYQPSSVLPAKGKKVDSPLPGYPTSDLSAIVLNKLLDGIEVKKKQ